MILMDRDAAYLIVYFLKAYLPRMEPGAYAFSLKIGGFPDDQLRIQNKPLGRFGRVGDHGQKLGAGHKAHIVFGLVDGGDIRGSHNGDVNVVETGDHDIVGNPVAF